MKDLMLKIENVSKQYKLGQIGGTTLRDELQRWSARVRGKEDPTQRVDSNDVVHGELFLALNNVSFEVEKGERVGIIGHNGAGKSTLLKLISRVTAPTSGRIGLNGRVASMLEVGTGFHPELTGRENVYMNGAILGMTKKEIEAKMEDIIEFSECRQFIDTPVKRYSSGMYVKLAFSVASHLDSEIMIMDEVLAVGDMAFQRKCLTKMKNISNEQGRTILYVSHNMSTIRQLCDRVIVLDHGRVVFDGDVESGINNYLGITNASFPTMYDLSKAKRPRRFHGTKIFLTNLFFLNKNSAIFDRRIEKMRFSIVLKANENIEDIRLILSFATGNGERVAFCQSEAPFLSVRAGETYSAEFEADLSQLIVGKYQFILDVFSLDENNNHLSYDHPIVEVPIMIVDSNPIGIKQDGNRWGTVELSNIHCQSAVICTKTC